MPNLKYKKHKTNTSSFTIQIGFVEVRNNKLIVLVNTAAEV